MGEQKTRRLFLDFEVDGKRLYPANPGGRNRQHHANLARFGSGRSRRDRATSRTRAWRRAARAGVVYVCAECGDLGCGVVTVELTVHPDAVTWSDWGFQTNYEEEVHRDRVPTFGTLTFDRAEYAAALHHALDRIASDR